MATRDQEIAIAERLLKALAEQLKSPLLHIAYHAELKQVTALPEIGATAARTLQLIDTYLLSTSQQQLEFEPVSVSSVLYDVAQALDPLARQHNCELEIAVAGKYGPVMAHQKSLEAALITLGQSLIEADTATHPRLVLSAYKNSRGIAAGAFGNHPDLTPDSFRRALALFGTARQPLANTSALNAAGLYMADALFESMDAKLQVAHHQKLTGLAASLVPSAQLQLV
jgi:hypothetical protein